MIKFLLFIFIFFISSACGKNSIKVATYNVENLFDLHYDGNEYLDYIPYGKSKWNRKNFKIKIKNIQKVIKDLDADIIALEEIESIRALKKLMIGLNYPYFSTSKKKSSTIISAILSKYPISQTKSLYVKSNARYPFRDILRVKIDIKNNPFYIYVNHWSSKRHPESQRIAYAKTIVKDLSNIYEPFIVLGDMNSYYDEFKTIKKTKKNNDTFGKTGINHILQSSFKNKKGTYKMVYKSTLNKNKKYLYNLWLEVNKKDRYSYQYKNKYITLDHILIPYSMLDNKGIEYKKKSFGVFKPKYLFTKNKNKKIIYRWQKERYKWGKGRSRSIHLGKGYSDHLPIFATFYVIDKK